MKNMINLCLLSLGVLIFACGEKSSDTSVPDEETEQNNTEIEDTSAQVDTGVDTEDSGAEIEDSGAEDSSSDNSTTVSGSLLVEMDYIDPSLEQAGYSDCTASYIYTESNEEIQNPGCPDCTHHWRVDIEYSSDCYNWEEPSENPIEIGIDRTQDIFYMYYDSYGWDIPYNALNCNSGVSVSSTDNRFDLVCEVINGTTSARTTTLSLEF